MKRLDFLPLVALCSLCFNLVTFNPITAQSKYRCIWSTSFELPTKGIIHKVGSRVLVKVSVNNHRLIKYMKLYVDGKFVRQETKYPYEWGQRKTDHLLTFRKAGRYTLKCRIYDICGEVKELIQIILVGTPPIDNVTQTTFQAPRARQVLYEGDYLYVRVKPQKKELIKAMTLYFDNRLIRKDTRYPFEWGKPANGKNLDSRMGKLKAGPHKLRCEIMDRYGKKSTIYRTIIVERKRPVGVPRQ